MGAPIIAVEKKPEGAPLYRTSPGTLFLRFNCKLKDIGAGACTGTLELYSAYNQTEIEVGDKKIPLERDVTAQLAYTIDQPYIQGLGFNEFLYGTGYIKTGLFYMQPYEPEKIPIVLVHGTFSSPVAWAELANTLRADPVINRKYQMWNFFYDSGKRVGISAKELRAALSAQVQQVDPEGTNAALRKMIVIGHSQGGLLTKLTATDTGDAFIRAVTGKSLAQLDASDEDRARIEQEAIFKPLPFVSRVVFIATPHRGSFLSKNWVRTLVLKMIALPKSVLQSTANLMTTVARLGVPEAHAQQFISMTSLDVMAPSNPAMQTLADIPLAPGVKGHSIVAIDGDETPPDGDDGVVKYTSAHVNYVESEFLVRHGHSCQSHPLVIEEVRRILLTHLKENQQLPEKVQPGLVR
jgi:pimeloyl-ACP methyl ester carboxylesterase